MNEFLDDLKSGEIQFRDRWQFELKSEFSPSRAFKESDYIQEFYFFIPNALQINRENYSKEDFYRDLTNFVRFKTPTFSLEALIDENNSFSPYIVLSKLLLQTDNDTQVIEEMKLLGNVFRSAIRDRVVKLLEEEDTPQLSMQLKQFCDEIDLVKEKIFALDDKYPKRFKNETIATTFRYLQEFINNTIDFFLTNLLDELRTHKTPLEKEVELQVCDAILATKTKPLNRLNSDEILYRRGLLKKFFLDALLLPVKRASIQEKYGHYIAALSAGIAMLVYILLFVWYGQEFVINSEPFIILTVVTYILKDRLKEFLKSISYQRAFKIFSDYTTMILSPDEKKTLGDMRESFAFINEEEIPKEIFNIRNREFHKMMPLFQRPEKVIYFKRGVKLFTDYFKESQPFHALNLLLRFNIQNFIEKASDPYHQYAILEPETLEILHKKLPKVYHLNVILKNSFAREKSEFKKYRIILDKDGIKYIEHLKL